MEGCYPFDDQFPNANGDFGPIDFMDEANFDQFIDLIYGDEDCSDRTKPVIQGYDFDHYQQNMVGVGDATIPPVGLFDFSHAADAKHDFRFRNDQCLIREEITDGISCTMNASMKTKSCNKVDRSKTLISERKRRGRMKEKLYALRSLVPNITKMDKASIVGDAVSYVQDLQMQAKNLKAEIVGLESSWALHSSNINVTRFFPVAKKILKMDAFQVDERGFYVRVVSNKGIGVAALLYKTIESLTNIVVESSNLTATSENYVLTFTMHIVEREMEANLQNLKLWIARIFINQGFEFEMSQSA